MVYYIYNRTITATNLSYLLLESTGSQQEASSATATRMGLSVQRFIRD